MGNKTIVCKFSEVIKEESSIEGFKDFGVVESVGFGFGRHFDNLGNAGSNAANRGGGTASTSPLTVVRFSNRYSPDWVKQCLTGNAIGTLIFHELETIDGKPTPCKTWEFTSVLLQQSNGNMGNGSEFENYGINFLTWAYKLHADWDGKKQTKGNSFTFDFGANKVT